MTVLTEIPLEFESYLRDKTLQNLPTNLNEFIFAHIPNLDLSVDIDRNSTIPSENLIVHRAPVASVGKTGENAIVYSAIIDSTVPEFTFNAIYLHDKNESDSCGMIIHQQDETKQQAMTITKSALMQYDSAAASAHVTVDAETWQVDISDLFAACSKIGHTHTLAEIGGSNPNLFINGDFSINQRFEHNTWIDDKTFPTAFFADRWRIRQSSLVGGTVKYMTNDNCGTVAGPGGSRMSVNFKGATSAWWLSQRIALLGYDTDDLFSKDFTVSYKMSSSAPVKAKVTVLFISTSTGTSVQVSDTVSTSHVHIKDRDVYVFTLKLPRSLREAVNADDLALQVDVEVSGASESTLPDTTLEFHYAKSELSSEATKLIPETPQKNLSECQFYYQKLTYHSTQLATWRRGAVAITCNFPTMRIPPAIIGSDGLYAYRVSGTLDNTEFTEISGTVRSVRRDSISWQLIVEYTVQLSVTLSDVQLDAEI